MKYLFRLVGALVGYNLCFFEVHHWVDGGRVLWDERYGQMTGFERYKLCSRCRTIKLDTIRRDYEAA